MATVAEKILELKPVIDGVYNAGKEDGHGVGYSKGYGLGYAAGKKTATDAFWDAFLNNGKAKSFFASFGSAWTEDTFKPPHNIVPTTLYMGFAGNQLKNIKQALDNCGVKLDTSQCWSLSHAFYSAATEELGVIDARGCGELISTFYGCKNLRKIERLILNDSGSQPLITVFNGCIALREIVITGTIGKSVDFRDCTNLSRSSILNILGCLKQASTRENVSLSQAAVSAAFETSNGANDGLISSFWLECLRSANTLNWTINLI